LRAAAAVDVTYRFVRVQALSRQKQMTDVPMDADVRLAAYTQREPIRPEKNMLCPKGHKITPPKAKAALAKHDVYTCEEGGCGTLCGGADVHPLHLEIRFLNPRDKHKYVDSCRWLSRSEVEVQTREYIHVSVHCSADHRVHCQTTCDSRLSACRQCVLSCDLLPLVPLLVLAGSSSRVSSSRNGRAVQR
jgi:hypothetical protein